MLNPIINVKIKLIQSSQNLENFWAIKINIFFLFPFFEHSNIRSRSVLPKAMASNLQNHHIFDIKIFRILDLVFLNKIVYLKKLKTSTFLYKEIIHFKWNTSTFCYKRKINLNVN